MIGRDLRPHLTPDASARVLASDGMESSPVR